MKKHTSKNRVCKVETTNEKLTGRGGLVSFVHYMSGIGIYELLTEKFGFIRKSKKGLDIENLFKQVFCFFFDGTSRHVSYFDALQGDEGYAAVIENDAGDMASSHAMKRFFKSFPFGCQFLFRWILRSLFIWRLRLEQPGFIELGLDTMVMDNDEAEQREGVEPTYKKVKGFQPLQITWRGKIVEAVFRGGKKHGNSGNTVSHTMGGLVKLIRNKYRADAVIVVRQDSGFYDEELFRAYEELGILFVAGGKMYEEIKDYVRATAKADWGDYENPRQKWEYVEFGYRGKSWEKFWRAFYTRPVYEEAQEVFEFARPDNIILTNIGLNNRAMQFCVDEQKQMLSRPETIIAQYHQRGADELPHRGLKDFGFEELPFKRFPPNCAFYYCMLISFFLFETYKEDVLAGIIPATSYATTVRRRAVDFAGKIVKRGRQLILKVPQAVMENLK